MDQQALEAPPAVESGDSKESDRGMEAEAGTRPAPPFIPGWRCVPHALVRAYGEEGTIDLVALQAERGAALVALLRPGEEASPEEARAAFLAMLADEGFATKFGGELPVVALTVTQAAADEIATAIEDAFAAMARPSLDGAWVDWLADRLAPARMAPVLPRLMAPAREEATPEKRSDAVSLVAPPRDEALPPPGEIALHAPRREEAAPEAGYEGAALPPMALQETTVTRAAAGALAETPEAPAHSVIAEQSPGWLDWGASLGFAVGIVLAILIGLAVFSHNGRLF
jgi:hypothetical protein